MARPTLKKQLVERDARIEQLEAETKDLDTKKTCAESGIEQMQHAAKRDCTTISALRRLLDSACKQDVQQQNAILRLQAQRIVLERHTREMRAKLQHIIFGLACRLDDEAQAAVKQAQPAEAAKVRAEVRVERERLTREHEARLAEAAGIAQDGPAEETDPDGC